MAPIGVDNTAEQSADINPLYAKLFSNICKPAYA